MTAERSILSLILIAAWLASASLPAGAEAPSPPDSVSAPAPGAFAGPMPIDPPAPPGSRLPALAAEDATTLRRGHDVLMTWLEPREGGGRLRFARRSTAGWTRPITIADGVTASDPSDRPSLTVIDTQGVRRTLIARTGDVVARSGDAGRTWARLPGRELPFAAFAPGDEGGYVFWLAGDDPGAARLVGARVLAGEEILDPRVAAGVSSDATMTWDGPVVAYRDETPEGARDVTLIRREEAEWTPPRPVYREGAHEALAGRETGPRVAALRRTLAVAWFSQAPPRSRVLVAFSSDAGGTFGAPVEVAAAGDAEGAPTGFVDLVLDDRGDALVVWTAAAAEGGAALRLARVSPAGGRGEAIGLAEGLSAPFEESPQIARAGARVVVTWVDGAGGRVRAASVALGGGEAEPDAPANEAPAAAPAAPRSRGRVGEPMPDLELVSLAGEAVSPSALRGRAVLLNLWATWCMPCIAEMPELAALGERYAADGLEVVGVSVDDAESRETVDAFVARHEIPFTVWLDPDMRLNGALRVRGLPATFVLDRTGRIVARRDGPVTADDPELLAAIRQALENP